MMSLWDALRMNMMISYQELVRTFPRLIHKNYLGYCHFFNPTLLGFC
ncbi:Ovule protein [Klebsiella quasipneumoniae subsp. quasipneumoniae]